MQDVGAGALTLRVLISLCPQGVQAHAHMPRSEVEAVDALRGLDTNAPNVGINMSGKSSGGGAAAARYMNICENEQACPPACVCSQPTTAAETPLWRQTRVI